MNATALLQGVAETRFVPGGVADAHGLRLFVRDVEGVLSALAVGDGERLWQTRDAGAPVIALNGAVLAASLGGMEALFRLCDEETGEVVWSARNSVAFVPASPLRGGRMVAHGSVMRLGWQASSVAVDFDSGAVSLQPPMEEIVAPLPFHDVREILRSADAQARPWRAGDRIAALVVDGRRLVLVTTDLQGNDAREVELLSPVPVPAYLQHHRSPDGEHVFLFFCNDEDGPEGPAGTVCRWIVHRVSDGKQVTTFPPRQGLVPPLAIAGARLLYLHWGERVAKKAPPETTLHALDTGSGEEVWSVRLAHGPTG